MDVVNTPFGIGNCKFFTKNNSSGIPITNIAIGSTIVTDKITGIVTVTLATPILGFSTASFEAGDKIFVEGVENEYGNTFNSPVNKFAFYPVERVIGGINPNPFRLEFNIHGGSFKSWISKNYSNFWIIINFKKYPKFTVITELSSFTIGEKLSVSRNDGQFIKVDLTVDRISNNYIKVIGNFELKLDDK